MTIVAMGLGYSITAADPTTLSANLAEVRKGLEFTPATASFLASLCTLTLAAAVLGAGALGDLAGMKRMFVVGIYGSIVFGVLGAVAPHVSVLIVARAGLGVAFAFVLGLSLAIINAVFPPGRRAAAIAAYLGAGHALAVFQPAVGGWLASHFGWRTCLLVTPVLAVLTLVITLRYVPETVRDKRKLDIPGILLIAAALVTVIYGLTELQGGLQRRGAGPDRGRPGPGGGVRAVGVAHRRPRPGHADLPLGPVQRRADRRCHLQLPRRRRNHPVRLLPGDHPREVAGVARPAAHPGHAGRLGRGHRGRPGRRARSASAPCWWPGWRSCSSAW